MAWASLNGSTNTSVTQTLESSASNEPDVERMVIAFRVQELKQLLMYAHQSVTGRKTDLTNRALGLVRGSKNQQLITKVKQLYLQLYDRDRSLLESNVTVPAPAPNGCDNIVSSPYGAYATAVANSGNDANGKSSTTWLSQIAARQNLAVNPDVKLTHLPFYDVLSQILKPTTIVPMSVGKFQDNHFSFSLSREQLMTLTADEKIALPRSELQLRFCLLNLSGDQKDDFPSGCILRMNDKMVQIPNPIPTNKVGVEPKRPSRPVDITQYISRGGNGEQRIHLSWNNDGVRHWTVSVFLVRHLTTQILMQRVRAKGERPAAESIDMIKEKLGVDGADREIAATSLRVSLLCPLGKIQMRLPCRLQSCKHLQCFDLELFLMMNEKRPTWTCPVCDSPTVPFSDLQVDGYFSRVIAETKDAHEVELYEGGGFSSIVDSDDAELDGDDKPVKASGADMEDRKPPVPSSSGRDRPDSSGRGSVTQCATDNEPVIIDLTDDDDNNAGPSGYANEQLVVVDEIESVSSACSSPSIIVLDSPRSPSPHSSSDPEYIPEGPKNPSVSNRKRLLSSRVVIPTDAPSKKKAADGPSDAALPVRPSYASVARAGCVGSSNGDIRQDRAAACYALMLKNLLGKVPAPVPPVHSQRLSPPSLNTEAPPPSTLHSGSLGCWRPPPPTSHSGSPEFWRPVAPADSGASSSSRSGSSGSSTTSAWPAHLSEEFEAFLKGCFPSSQ